MRTLVLMGRGLLAMPLWVQIWFGFMMLANAIAPLFFLNHMVAQLTFFCAAIGMPIGYLIVYMTGFSKLMGLMHGPWLALAYVQIYTLATTAPSGAFGNWLMVSAAVTLVSLAFDAYDVVVYARQNKAKFSR